MSSATNQGSGSLERSFADFIQRLAGDQGSSTLFAAAAQLGRARIDGHICLDLNDLAAEGDAATITARLLAGPVVGGPGQARPLILEGRYLYLERYHRAETLVADFITRQCHDEQHEVAMDTLAAALARFFDQPDQEGTNWQQVAAMAALTRRFTVISGGPGTGKTTTVAKILALYQELHQGQNRVIRLAAPTGKAAARLQESIQQAREGLPVSAEMLAALPRETVTIHRLLGLVKGRPRHHRHHPLALDLLVVDEASMVDLPLMAQLMDALPPHCSLILLGDHYQLASVQPGAVLGDICGQGQGFSPRFRTLARELGVFLEDGKPGRTNLADAIITLRTSYRFKEDSGIRRLSQAVNQGHGEEALAILADTGCPDVKLVEYGDSCEELVRSQLAPAFTDLHRARSGEAALAALDRSGVLCALRRGPSGTERINDILVRTARGEGHFDHPLYSGLPVMITGNSYELELFNGDTGVIGMEDDHLYASFPGPTDRRRFLARRLPAWQAAYAITIHKSQGSEFDRVVVILPPRPSPILGRELLYTALTRARQSVEVWGSSRIFLEALATPVQRVSGLAERLWGSTGR